jgi:metal-sulfur cluster biosynthetic enzyme
MHTLSLQEAVIEKLRSVIDPETGEDVVRMNLIQDINMNDEGKIFYTFRPSSPLCPIAVPLALAIIKAINEVPGTSGQNITVVDYIQADELNEILRSILD